MNGVIYQLSGMKSAGLLAVSLYTLRKHYSGPVTIAYVASCRKAAFVMRKQFDAHAIKVKNMRHGINKHFTLKPVTYRASVYSRAVFLDADTIIQAPIENLFQCDWGVAQVGGCRIRDDSGRAHFARKRLSSWLDEGTLVFELVTTAMRHNTPVFNTGVFAFDTKHPMLSLWESVVLACCNHRTVGELAMMLLYPYVHNFNVLSDSVWNFNKFSKGNECDAAIVHYHHGRWKRRDSSFWDSLRECKAATSSPELLAILATPLESLDS